MTIPFQRTGVPLLFSVLMPTLLSCSASRALDFYDGGELDDVADARADAGEDGEEADAAPAPPSEQLRVIYVVDRSESMRVNDPTDPVTGLTSIQVAVSAAIEELFERYPDGISFSAVRFASEAQVLTYEDMNGNGVAEPDEGRFSSSKSELIGDDGYGGIIPSLGINSRTSNYTHALAVTYSLIREELARIARSDDATLSSTRFVVILVGDFLPDILDEGEITPNSERALQGVRSIVDLARLYGVSLELHCAYIQTNRSDIDERASTFGTILATEGGGRFVTFSSPEELDLDLI